MFLAMAVVTPEVTPTPKTEAVASDIVVLGGRLKSWIGKFSVKGNQSKCSTKKSSGDKEIDAFGCESFAECLAPLQPRIDASDNASLDKDTRLKMKTSIRNDLNACVIRLRDQLVANLAERRYQARQRTSDAPNQ